MATKGLQRHFEGWQVGAVIVGFALVCVWLAVPRPVTPSELPVPRIDRPAERREEEREAKRAEQAREHPLSVAVRTVGERFRRYGVEEAARDRHGVDHELNQLRQKISDVLLEVGPETLLQLRAVQTELFVEAAEAWAATSSESGSEKPSQELLELGGDFAGRAAKSGWTEGGRLAISRGTAAALFRLRWSKITGLDKGPFAPSLSDELLFARMMLVHPLLSSSEASEASLRVGTDPGLTSRQLRAIADVAKRQPDYPARVARGVLFFRDGKYEAALRAFEGHLELYPNGPWTLRTVNYRAGTVEAMGWLD